MMHWTLVTIGVAGIAVISGRSGELTFGAGCALFLMALAGALSVYDDDE
jgi:hypothetical protein